MTATPNTKQTAHTPIDLYMILDEDRTRLRFNPFDHEFIIMEGARGSRRPCAYINDQDRAEECAERDGHTLPLMYRRKGKTYKPDTSSLCNLRAALAKAGAA